MRYSTTPGEVTELAATRLLVWLAAVLVLGADRGARLPAFVHCRLSSRVAVVVEREASARRGAC